jgi:hypothetical protein
MGKYLGKTTHKRFKSSGHKSRRIQRGGKMTSEKLKYLLELRKRFLVKDDPGEMRRIINIDIKSRSKNSKIASTIDSKDIREIIQMLKTDTPEKITNYIQQLENQESSIVLERANTPPMTEPRSTEMPFRFDPTIPDVGSTENFGAYGHPGFRHRPRSPRRVPPAPMDKAYLDALDSTDSVMGPWALSVADPSHIPPQHRYGMRRVVHPPAPAPAPYSHDASVSTISSPRGHRRAAAYNHSLDVIPPSSHAPADLYDSMDGLRPEMIDRMAALRNRPGAIARADFVDVPPGIGVRGRGARAASPSSSHVLPVARADSVAFPASPIGLITNPELPRSTSESRRGAVAPPASRDVSRLSPRASNASMTSQLPMGRGALQHSELDMVRYDTGSSVAPLSRSHSRPPSVLLNSVDYLEHPQYPWERPSAASLPPIPPPASAARLPSAPASAARPPSASASAAKAASPKSMVSPKANKQQQKQAWMLGMFDSTAEKVARPDTEEFDFTASVAELPRASTAKPMKSIFGSDNDFDGLFPKRRLVGVHDAGPAMLARPQSDSKSLQRELEEAEQKIIDDERRDQKIQEASRAAKAIGDEILRKKREETKAREQAQSALKQQKRDAKEARNREYATRIAELEQMPKRTSEQQLELTRLKTRLAFGDDDDDDDDSSGGGRRRTKRIKKRGRRSYKIKKSRKNMRYRRSGRK